MCLFRVVSNNVINVLPVIYTLNIYYVILTTPQIENRVLHIYNLELSSGCIKKLYKEQNHWKLFENIVNVKSIDSADKVNNSL